MALKSGSFATFLIVCRESIQSSYNLHHKPIFINLTTSNTSPKTPKLTIKPATCFFLGIIFSLFPYDYPILWSTIPTPESHFDYLEAHLKFLHASPPLIPRILHIVIFLGLAGLVAKLYKPSESNMLFDGASLVLYMCGVTVYIANIVKGLRLASAGQYGNALASTPEERDQILGREDSLKVLSASNTILALVLVGILVLQAGQWYAERKDDQEAERFAKGKKSDEVEGEVAAVKGKNGSKKKN
ncbi:secretory component protein shr3 [Penicillium malachiteum]|uniref:Secretory component protein shr3 n=1 Tax=Penicillium malachiteum TaxID=1324776 RepID=A0AAD6HKV8_9EURO|nr:secretory component protein shr3 [Penicillium malachiteum]